MESESRRVVLRRDAVYKKLREMQPELETQGISSLGLFGSVVRDEATGKSDVDLAITTRPEWVCSPSLGCICMRRSSWGGG